jgi:hypothetical protein|tara:strand:- start:106 stop:981 length:876 start_codon:yes stop_codon:yes gene_type:complete
MNFYTPIKINWGFLMAFFMVGILSSQDMPVIFSSKTQPTEKGLKIEFLLSSFIERGDVSSWIEQENWFIINFYNIIRPEPNFFDHLITYPIQDIQQKWSQNSLQLSIQVNRAIGIFDVLLYDEGKEVIIALTYSDFVEAKEANPSYVFPDLKDAQKKNHPTSWKDARERTTLEILCDTKGLPIYVDNQLVGYSPLKNYVDVLPGWHKVGYFSNDYSQDGNSLTAKDKMLNDILVMGRLDIFVDEGKHETIALNYQTLDKEVIDFNNRFKTGSVVGFSLFFTMIMLMAWGLA